jgi:Phage-integrase repeat unit
MNNSSGQSRWRNFEGAREFAVALGLHGLREWNAWKKTGQRPKDIPSNPEKIYRDQGWAGMSDWLGYAPRASRHNPFRPFTEARDFARALQLQTWEDWISWSKSDARPYDIPATPHLVYKDVGWSGMGDWLGTGRLHPSQRVYLPFQVARAISRDLGFRNQTEWLAWVRSKKSPDGMPRTPSEVYKNAGWQGWRDWLATDTMAPRDRGYRAFSDARAFVRVLGLTSTEDWNRWARSAARPVDIPRDPRHVYRDLGWKSTGDWLGTGTVHKRDLVFRPFDDARTFVQSVGLRNQAEWRRWAKTDAKPHDIPAGPPHIYKDQGWQGWGDWLGTGNTHRRDEVHREFADARSFARSLSLVNREAWKVWARSPERPLDIPALPNDVYANTGWLGWGDWLGTGNLRTRDIVFRPFQEARAFARSLRLRSSLG